MTASWVERFPGLATLEPEVRTLLLTSAKVVTVPAGTIVFGPGHPPDSLLLLLEGQVRVQQTSDTGREIVLYRVHSGESCVMTTACLLAYEDYAAEGIAETDVEAVAIPRDVFDTAISRSPAFRQVVFHAFSRRIADLFHTIEEVAFGRIDVRLAQRLIELAAGDSLVAATHGALASELGTAREVISRHLAEFQRRCWIAQSRGRIEILDRPAIEAFAAAA